jgi:hypothetical protein
MSSHKRVCEMLNRKNMIIKYISISASTAVGINLKIKILEEVLVSSTIQLELIEDTYIVQHKSTLNSRRARRTNKQYKLDNRDK